ncbi:hypothetical protein ACS0TY_003664 [Phlomoides rotata]
MHLRLVVMGNWVLEMRWVVIIVIVMMIGRVLGALSWMKYLVLLLHSLRGQLLIGVR